MLDNFYTRPWTRRDLRSGAIGPVIDDFVAHLVAQRYSYSSIRKSIRFVACLGRWLKEEKIELALVDEAVLDRFAAELPRCRYVRANRGAFAGLRPAIGLLLSWLRIRGVVASRAPSAPPLDPLITAFEAWIRRHRGIAVVTLKFSYRPFLVRFLASAGRTAEKYTASAVRRFILEQAEQHSRRSVQTGTSAIRMFLRYLAAEGRCLPELVGAVPTVARWRKDVLPRFISPDDVERILSGCDSSDRVGCRDRAVLLLLARLGLRAGDVRGLRLGDLDWGGARVRVCGKGRREGALPLPQDVGDALLAYVLGARPEVGDDHVFITTQAPYHALGASAVTTIAVRAAARANAALPRGGAHVLRHSLATSLLAGGMSLPGIGAVLRHQNSDTTLIYARVDPGLLITVARPWPIPEGS